MSVSTAARSLLTLMLVSLMPVLVPSVEAQLERPAKRQTGVVNAADPAASVAINPDVIALKTSSDLIIKVLGFDWRGNLTFELMNRGEVPINPAAPPALAGGASRAATPAVPESEQIKVAVYLNNAPVGTVFQPRLAGKTSKIFAVAVPESVRPPCGQARPLRTVIDPSNVIVELTDTNNVDTVTAARPCPDLAVESVTKNFNDAKTEYVARITVINKGNAPAETFEYWAQEDFGGNLADLGGQADESTGPLGPGQTFKFNIGRAFPWDNMRVTVMLDRRGLVEELDESNNYKEKALN